MRSQKVRLKPTKEQEDLMWWYSKVSRNYWNLLVDIDRRNNKGEFDEILKQNGNKTYYSKFYNRDIYSLNKSDYRNLAKIVVAKKVDRFYPSSRLCSTCGNYKPDLKLSQRVYHCCHCGIRIDRDFNASINIANTNEYVLV